MKVDIKEFDIPVLCSEKECERCQDKLSKALTEVKGITHTEVNNSTLSISFDPNILSIERLEKKTKEIGCTIAEKFTHETLELAGLDCPDCAMKMEKSIGRLPGVLWATVNFTSSTLGIEFESDKTSLDKVIQLIRDLGYQVITDEKEAEISYWEKNKRTLATGVAGLFLLAGFITSLIPSSAPVSDFLYAVAIVVGGYFIAKSGFISLRMKTLDMNFLVTIAALSAAFIGQWLEGALVLFLFSVGNTLESYAMERNRRELRSLIDQSPKVALVRRSHHEVVLSVEQIVIGDIVIVKPGERMPVDGLIISGSSSVNQAPITGESLPVEKSLGDNVYAGSINGNGALEVKATKFASDSTIAKVMDLIERAQEQKAPAQLFTERFGRIYTPVVVISAAVIAFIAPLLFNIEFSRSIYIAAVLLVVSCPCALVISVPVAVVSALANAARHGILVKGGVFLEAAGAVKAIAFDKTGTLTVGRPDVTDIVNCKRYTTDTVLTIAAAVESRSEHPIAKSVHRAGIENEIINLPVRDFEAFPGGGAKADVEGVIYFIGSHRFFEKMELPISEQARAEKLEDEGKSVLFVGSKDEMIGLIAISDKLREESIQAIKDLKQMGIEHITMLTGDNQKTAKIIAEKTGVDDYRYELLPADKVEAIKELQNRYTDVAMVGDGINDAPALATANIGIAMGAAGTDVALETADMALMSDDIMRLPYAINLSKRALSIVKQNVIFSMAVIVVLIISTLFGQLSLSLGIIGHEGSALLVIANGMRLLRSVR